MAMPNVLSLSHSCLSNQEVAKLINHPDMSELSGNRRRRGLAKENEISMLHQ